MAELPIETAGEDSQAVPRKLGHARLDLILALSAIFISAVSLLVAIQNSRIQRELVAADTWPFVQRTINDRFGPDRDMTIGVSNDGVGPAKIRSVELFLDGQPYFFHQGLAEALLRVSRRQASTRAIARWLWGVDR